MASMRSTVIAPKLKEAKVTAVHTASTLIGAPAGTVRVRGGRVEGRHPADGMVADVHCGDGAHMSIINPQSFKDGGPEWVMRYGNAESIRFTVAGLLESYDYLLSGNITTNEAIRRLRMLRSARALLVNR
jgi:hypothetical protein